MRKMNENPKTSWTVALAAGGAAGTAVDVALFPLDTIKTRLQSNAGFLRYSLRDCLWENESTVEPGYKVYGYKINPLIWSIVFGPKRTFC